MLFSLPIRNNKPASSLGMLLEVRLAGSLACPLLPICLQPAINDALWSPWLGQCEGLAGLELPAQVSHLQILLRPDPGQGAGGPAKVFLVRLPAKPGWWRHKQLMGKERRLVHGLQGRLEVGAKSRVMLDANGNPKRKDQPLLRFAGPLRIFVSLAHPRSIEGEHVAIEHDYFHYCYCQGDEHIN